MKSPETALNQWVSDEIKFHGGKAIKVFTRSGMELLAKSFRENNNSVVLGMNDLGPDPKLAIVSSKRGARFLFVREAIEWTNVHWIHKLPNPPIEVISAQWLASFEDADEVSDWFTAEVYRRRTG